MTIDEVRSRLATLGARFDRHTEVETAPAIVSNRAGISAFHQLLSTQTGAAPPNGTLGQMWQSLLATPWPTSTGPSGSVPERAAYFEPEFQRAGARYGVDPDLLAAVAWTESAFNPDAVSHAGAIGLMQIMPGTAEGLGVDPRDPAQAIDGAARYLRSQLDRFGDVRLALAAYNAGPGAVEKYGGVPPYAETTAYVAKVVGRLQTLRSTP